MSLYNQDAVESLLRELEEAVAREIRDGITAGSCGCSSDFRRYHRSEMNTYEKRDKVVKTICDELKIPFRSAAGENDPEEEEE